MAASAVCRERETWLRWGLFGVVPEKIKTHKGGRTFPRGNRRPDKKSTDNVSEQESKKKHAPSFLIWSDLCGARFALFTMKHVLNDATTLRNNTRPCCRVTNRWLRKSHVSKSAAVFFYFSENMNQEISKWPLGLCYHLYEWWSIALQGFIFTRLQSSFFIHNQPAPY